MAPQASQALVWEKFRPKPTLRPPTGPTHGAVPSLAWTEEDRKRLQTILDFLNDCVQQTNIDSKAVECSDLVSGEVKERYRQGALSRQTEGSFILRYSAGKVRLCRDVLDCLLAKELASPEVRQKEAVPGECTPQCSVAQAAASAREAALEEYQLRRQRRKALWFVSAIVLAGLLGLDLDQWQAILPPRLVNQ